VRFRGEPIEGVDVAVETIGVGLVEAALGMTRCIARHAPSAALLLGTCGLFDATPRPLDLGVGSVVTGSSVHLVDAAVIAKTAALPAPMPANATFDASLHGALVAAGAKSVQIANTVGITIDDAHATLLANGGGAVEHLEAFAFARACGAADVPCASVLGIANVVGANGRTEWLANHESASAKAAEVALAAKNAISTILRTTTIERSPARA
jgi:nucleoside phosphorylase